MNAIIQHPKSIHQAIRTARDKLTPQVQAAKDAGLAWQIVTLETVICEDHEHVMFYGETEDPDVIFTACVRFPVPPGQDLDRNAWDAAYWSVLSEDGDIVLH